MSYQVIARKYRPQCFADVVGQEHVTQTLTNAIQQNRIAHAYLFVGPRGTGKTTIARIFAKCLNCTGGPKVDFPEDDPRAREIAEGRSLDVFEIDGASNRGIEEIRELRETVKYAPATSKFKIYIIDEVHMLTKEAFNALLKTLEEPPAHVKFMFATTEPEKVLPTILSRCQRFDLRRIPTPLIITHLAHIAKLENVSIDEDALRAIARGADGGMRDAESALDQLISFCGERIAEADVLSMFGLTSQTQILALVHAIVEGDAAKTLQVLNELTQHGKDLSRLLSDVLIHFRNLLVYQISRGDLSLLDISESEATMLKKDAPRLSAEVLTRIMEVLTDYEGRLRDAASRKILVEIALLKAIEARQAVSIDAVLAKLEQLRGGSGAEVVSIPQPGRAAPSAPKPAPAPFRAEQQMRAAQMAPSDSPPAPSQPAAAPLNDMEALWAQLLEAVGRVSQFTRSYLLEAHPVSLARNLLTVGFDPEFADKMGLVDNSKTHAVLQTKLQELGHSNCQVKFIQAEAPAHRAQVSPQPAAPAAAPTPLPATNPSPPNPASPKAAAAKPGAEAQRLSKEDFKNDPLIQKALEVFKGQIVEVRS